MSLRCELMLTLTLLQYHSIRADHKASGVGGPAAVTNGGNAMLVMRNFGYLGLHVSNYLE